MASEATRRRRTAATDAAQALIGGARLAADRVAILPRRTVVLTLVVMQWLLLAVAALRTSHDGWTWDPAHAPTGAAATLLPGIVLVQTIVLAPLAVALVYALAERLAGRMFAAWAGALWVLLPYAGYAYSDPTFRNTYPDRFLVHVTGLSADPRFAALVLFLAGSVLALRATETGAAAYVAGAVAAVGLAVGFVPRAATVALAIPVALLAAGRRRMALEAAAGLAVLLAGVGVAVHAGWLGGPLGAFAYTAPHTALASLQESFWSGSLLEWLTIGGLLAAFRGRPSAAVLVVAASLFAFLSMQGGANATDLHVALLQGMLPAWFGVVLAVASLPLLVPGLGRGRRPASDVIADWRIRLRAPAFPRRAAEARDDAAAMPLWIAIAIGCVLVFIAFVGTWNAARYPVMLGYDAPEHTSYAYHLIYSGTLPQQSQSGEYYTPPGYYAVAGAAFWIAGHLGLPPVGPAPAGTSVEPYQAAQYLNVAFLLGTALLLVVLARLLFPRRPVIALAAVSFLALVPAVTRAAAMFYPETMNMLVSTACLTLATWMLVRRRFQLRWAAALAVLLAIGQLVRASAIFTSIAIAIALAAALASHEYRRHMPLRRLGVAVAALALLITPWYVYQSRSHSISPSLSSSALLHPGGSSLPFFQLRQHELFATPFRPHLVNSAVPELYADVWGDWVGAFAWSSYSEAPSTPALRLMQDQMKIGLLPTLLALGGWVALIAVATRRRLDGIPLIPVILLSLLAVGADVYRAYAIPTPDGDLLKASYALTSVPGWALGFGLAVDWLARRRAFAIALVVGILLMGGLELRFILYGIREHHPIF